MSGDSALIANLGVRGVWQPQTMALMLNIHITDTDDQSCINCSDLLMLCFLLQNKKRRVSVHKHWGHALHLSLILCCLWMAMGSWHLYRARSFMMRLAENLAFIWSKPFVGDDIICSCVCNKFKPVCMVQNEVGIYIDDGACLSVIMH